MISYSQNTVGSRLCWILGNPILLSSWELMKKQGESSFSLSTVKQHMKTHISWLSKTFVEESWCYIWEACWGFPIWHKWSIWHFSQGNSVYRIWWRSFPNTKRSHISILKQRGRERTRGKLTVFWTVRINSGNKNWTRFISLNHKNLLRPK